MSAGRTKAQTDKQMTFIAINPGSGVVESGSIEQSEINIKAFIDDLLVENVQYEFIKIEENGRHSYRIFSDEISHEIDMPAIPLEEVRYLGVDGQNIWHYPRLYVDGSSLVWKYALNMCFRLEEEEA